MTVRLSAEAEFSRSFISLLGTVSTKGTAEAMPFA
jgi:hypothetical protein